MAASIPVVDFAKLSSDQEECKKLRVACEKCGCFRIINHPIPLTLMADMKLVAKHLHYRPKDIKICNKDVIRDSGYVSSVDISPLYEGLEIYDMHSSPHAVQDFCSQLDVSPHHRQIIEAYGHAIHDLASSVSQKMAESLGIKDIDFKDWPFIFRFMKYTFTPEAIGSLGIPLHSDTGFITVAQDDETVGGIELMDDSNSFKAILPIPGSFLCIIGDIGHAWSNGRFWNVKHRVLCKEATTRYSFGAFMLASRDGNVEPHAKLVDHDHERLYRPFKYEDLRDFKITTRKRAGEFLEQLRIG
ncbi:2-oxoglutarate-dependent dioxygenase DAO [Spatholobus suberectus]|nr:2-oxoglutarate-dependent dioxygenase DAO [Spatholobus suberectus]